MTRIASWQRHEPLSRSYRRERERESKHRGERSRHDEHARRCRACAKVPSMREGAAAAKMQRPLRCRTCRTTSAEVTPEVGGKLFVLGLRLTLASHGDLDVGDNACYTPTPQRGRKRALWEREPDQPHEETHGLGAAVRKIEGDTPRRAKSQPNSCVSLEGNPRRCTELTTTARLNVSG